MLRYSYTLVYLTSLPYLGCLQSFTFTNDAVIYICPLTCAIHHCDKFPKELLMGQRVYILEFTKNVCVHNIVSFTTL